MSDFIYSRKPTNSGNLSEQIQSIYLDDKPQVKEFHGTWGALAVSRNLYNGFQPFENDKHIFLVVGGPVLTFTENNFLTEKDKVAGTYAIYHRWITREISWDEDLSGPFVILIIDKISGIIECVTDLMSFIPVYKYSDRGNLALSTHVDALARSTKQLSQVDLVSQIDFILHGVVTYPYTLYKTIKQIAPATAYIFTPNDLANEKTAYWNPYESNKYTSLEIAAKELQNGVEGFVLAVTSDKKEIGQFISGGEDSRTLSGLLPKQCKREAFIFLDAMNREGNLAKKAAEAYGANFNLITRSKTHYLNILPACATLVGSSSQYQHVHTFGFHESCALNKYPVVFGGFYADGLLKGSRIRKINKYPFLAQTKDTSYSAAKPLKNELFSEVILDQLTLRRQDHLNFVKKFRNESAEEWFELWPSSMNRYIPNIHGNRRLFRSYEPFTSNRVVKISAQVPQEWKLNRLLFHKFAKPYLKSSKWLFHSEGRLPFFPWYINSLVVLPTWISRKIKERAGMYGLYRTKNTQGPWAQWSTLLKTKEWQQTIKNYSEGMEEMEDAFTIKDPSSVFKALSTNFNFQVSFTQMLYFNKILKELKLTNDPEALSKGLD